METETVKSIEYIGKRQTYDVNTLKNHNFTLGNDILTHNTGSGRIEGELRNVEETIRKEQINLIFNSPLLRSHVHHYILKTAGYDQKHNMFKLLVYSQDAKQLMGYITVAVPPQDVIDEYLKKKDAYTSNVKERKSLTNKDDIARALLDYEPWASASNISERIAAVGRYFRENSLGSPGTGETHEISGLAKTYLRDAQKEK